MANGQLLNAIAAQAQQPQPMALQVAAPLDSMQLVALVAAQLGGSFDDVKEVVARAVDIVAHSVVAVNTGGLANRVKQLVREVEEERRLIRESN